MSRLFIIVAIVAVIYWLFKSYSRQAPKQDASPQTQDMVACVHCGVNLPKSESVLVDGKYYCSTAHSQTQADK
jgi:uncharacterized protein